jgi:hypothetical protein
MDGLFDLIIAGGGLSGVLAAVKAHEANRDLSILLIEKEPLMGGRLKAQNIGQNQWGYGFSALHEQLFQYWNGIMKADPDGPDLPSFLDGKIERAGILAGSKLTEVEAGKLFSSEGAYAIAGAAAVRDWAKVEQVIEKLQAGKASEQNFGQSWPGTRKDPATIILSLLGNLWGFPEPWNCSSEIFMEMLAGFKSPRYLGHWQSAIDTLLARPGLKEKLTIKTSCRIAGASREQGSWSIHTGQGVFKGRHLTVTMPPWEALAWLSKEQMPPVIVQMCARIRPVSVVTLSDHVQSKKGGVLDWPQIVLVPAEQVQVMVRPHTGEVSYQATLDFELSLQAPDVVKAVKRLKRARKKLLALDESYESQGDHIALKPVGWPRLPTLPNLRLMKQLGEYKYQAVNLSFCGDAYGSACDSDLNIIASLNSAVECWRELRHT